jgi:hypothetical protein
MNIGCVARFANENVIRNENVSAEISVLDMKSASTKLSSDFAHAVMITGCYISALRSDIGLHTMACLDRTGLSGS